MMTLEPVAKQSRLGPGDRVRYAVTPGWSDNHRSPQISRLPLPLKLSIRAPLHTR